MDVTEYLAQRVDDQMQWYSRKATTNKERYFALRLIELVGALIIPVFAAWGALNDDFPLEIVVAVTGFVVALTAGVLSLSAAQENWLKYRITAESLLQHKFRYLTGAAPYGDGAFGELVNNVESLIAEENTNWGRYQSETDSDAGEG